MAERNDGSAPTVEHLLAPTAHPPAGTVRGRGWRHRVVPFWVGLGTAIMRVGFQLQVVGAEHVPRHGAALIAANHPTYLDPPTIYAAAHRACQRQVHFMAADFLFDLPIIGPWLPVFGAFPVSLERPEVSAFRQAVTYLQKGHLVGMFPEGGRSTWAYMQPKLKTGVIRVAWKTGLPILPATIVGGFRTWPIYRHWRFPRFKRTTVIFHPPFYPEKPKGLDTTLIESGNGFKRARKTERMQSIDTAHREVERLREIIEAPLRQWCQENRPTVQFPSAFFDEKPVLPRPRFSDSEIELPDIMHQLDRSATVNP